MNHLDHDMDPPVALAARYRQRRLMLLIGLLAVTVLPIILLGAWSLWPLLMIPAALAAPLAGGPGLVGTLLAVAVALAAASAGDVSAAEVTAGFASVVVLSALGATHAGLVDGASFARRAGHEAGGDVAPAVGGLAPASVFEVVADRDCRRAAEQGIPVAVAVVTMPSLGRIVARHGQATGLALLDAAHHGVARVIASSDLVADMGDGRFIALVGGDASQARGAAERIAVAVESVRVRSDGGVRVGAGAAAIGTAQWAPGDHGVDAMVSRAEASLQLDARAPGAVGDAQVTGEFRSVAVADAA